MREGNHTEADIELLNTRLIESGQCINVPHLCCLNSNVDEHNQTLFKIAVTAGADHAVIPAQHVSIQSDKFDERNPKQFRNSEKTTEPCVVLYISLPVVVGQVYEISANLSVEDGLMNGSSHSYEIGLYSPGFPRQFQIFGFSSKNHE